MDPVVEAPAEPAPIVIDEAPASPAAEAAVPAAPVAKSPFIARLSQMAEQNKAAQAQAQAAQAEVLQLRAEREANQRTAELLGKVLANGGKMPAPEPEVYVDPLDAKVAQLEQKLAAVEQYRQSQIIDAAEQSLKAELAAIAGTQPLFNHAVVQNEVWRQCAANPTWTTQQAAAFVEAQYRAAGMIPSAAPAPPRVAAATLPRAVPGGGAASIVPARPVYKTLSEASAAWRASQGQ